MGRLQPLLFLALAATSAAGHGQRTLSQYAGVGDHAGIGNDLDGTTPRGIMYKTQPGFQVTTCGEQCQGSVYMTPSAYACAILCTMDPTCGSAFYRIADGYCSHKTEVLTSEVLGVTNDSTSSYVAIEITRSSEPKPSPEPSPSPSPTWEEPSPSPMPEPRAPQAPDPSPSPMPKPMAPQAPEPIPPPMPKPMAPQLPEPIPSPEPSPEPSPSPIATPPFIGRDGPSGGIAGPVGEVYHSTMTIFHGFGKPYGGCGVGMEDMVDKTGKILPYIAFNRYQVDGVTHSMFQEGANCGRWIKITIGAPCGGSNDGQGGEIEQCISDPNGGVPDSKTGKVIYGYVGDSCQDTNGWCRNDKHHVDMGIENMERQGLDTDWRNNRISWSFLDGTAPGWEQGDPEFRWCVDSKIDWLCVMIVRVPNGVKSLEVLMTDGTWEQGKKVYILGQQFELPPSTFVAKNAAGKYTIRATDFNGKSYGTYELNPPKNLPYVSDAQ